MAWVLVGDAGWVPSGPGLTVAQAGHLPSQSLSPPSSKRDCNQDHPFHSPRRPGLGQTQTRAYIPRLEEALWGRLLPRRVAHAMQSP